MTLPGGYVALDVLTAANMNLLPGGQKAGGRARLSGSNQTGITTNATVTGSTVTFTAVTGRLYRLSMRLHLQQVTSAGNATVFFARGGTPQFYAWQGPLTTTLIETVSSVEFEAPGAGSVSYTLIASTSAGTLTIANSQSPGFLMVEDAGPST